MEYDDYDDEGAAGGEARHFELQKEQQIQMELYNALAKARRPPLFTMYKKCVSPILFGESAQYIAEIVALCLIVNLLNLFKFLPKTFRWFVSSLIGIGFLYRWFGLPSLSIFLVFVIVSYILLSLDQKIRLGNVLLPIYCLSFFILLQLLFLNGKQFTKIRGILMIMAMKIISLKFGVKNSQKEKDDDKSHDEKERSIDFFEYSAYIWNISTVVFGPWQSFEKYRLAMQNQNWKIFTWGIFFGIFLVIWSLICLIFTSCALDWLILDEYAYYSKILIQYKHAASFRFSHYFVSYFSEASVLLGGFQMLDSRHVTNFWKIEFPRSLTDVVINWNIPMHNWLKTYVFQPSLRFGPFMAIILTYIASSALHGFNFQISAVLLSLGFYSYGEYILRNKLANSFDACIGARKCLKCEHKHKWLNIFVLAFNLLFMLISIYHLIYLGMLFDSSQAQFEGYNFRHVWNKWNEANFVSFYLGLGVFILGWLI